MLTPQANVTTLAPARQWKGTTEQTTACLSIVLPNALNENQRKLM
jgi:hypothetical protein